MARRFYANTAVDTTLASNITSGATSLTVASATGYPTVPFVIVIEPDTANEEFILVGAKSGTSFTSLTRGFDGSSAVAHNSPAVIKHVAVALDFTEAWTHKHLAADGHTALDFGAPVASAPGDTQATGSATAVANAEHRHAREAAAAGLTFVYKTADESVASSTALQDDDHLFFTLAANGIYAFEALLSWTCPSTIPDFKWEWVEPDGTYEMQIVYNTSLGWVGQRHNETTGAITVSTDTSPNVYGFKGIIRAGGAGGTFKLQWAQGTSDAGATVLKLGSWLSYKKLN